MLYVVFRLAHKTPQQCKWPISFALNFGWFSPNTMLRYLNCLISCGELCKNLHLNLADLDDVHMADLLMTGASEVGRFSSMTLKAIRSAFKTFGITCFEHCFSPIVSSFCKTKFVTERKESLPLPLIVLVQWERRILQREATPAEILILGAFLVMAFSGMRFGDIQRVLVGKPLELWRDVRSGMKTAGGIEKGMLTNWLPFWERYGCVLLKIFSTMLKNRLPFWERYG